jgi:hypothetical protein
MKTAGNTVNETVPRQKGSATRLFGAAAFERMTGWSGWPVVAWGRGGAAVSEKRTTCWHKGGLLRREPRSTGTT